ncbi:nuclease-related domain-containing protein [Melittangium boletus]|uniref:NERD domain-containing protein n=1 Tax=Melittangium boletus DSM 14713 TaxID=1294270 RepID=A0A286SG92_9BACT|nr:nuclease-related domain-containing protein [Melittangium boletus]ATB26596.1 hypothetical protein MEBOL_000024 [Melittangium boletus DSM 14713]
MQGVKKTRQSRTRRAPGQSAREQERLIADRTLVKTAMEQAWAQGAAGEEYVGGLLNTLREKGWTAIHDLRRGSQGSNVDHLVIGPAGVFVIDTKWVSGKVWVAGSRIRVNNFPQNYLEKLEEQVFYVHERLLAASGRPSLWVQGLLVFVEPQWTVKEQPFPFGVLSDEDLLPALTRMPRRFSADEVAELARAASRAATWT